MVTEGGVGSANAPSATRQVAPFSQPKPSPSGSLLLLVQVALFLLIAAVAVTGLVVDAVTRQVALFSQPKPSPSESLEALVQMERDVETNCADVDWLACGITSKPVVAGVLAGVVAKVSVAAKDPVAVSTGGLEEVML